MKLYNYNFTCIRIAQRFIKVHEYDRRTDERTDRPRRTATSVAGSSCDAA